MTKHSARLHSRAILRINPNTNAVRSNSQYKKVQVYDYNTKDLQHYSFDTISLCNQFKNNNHISWINIEGICKNDIETLATTYDIHPLLVEDILSIGQRPKIDEGDQVIFCQLNMLNFNEVKKIVETEQISLIIGKGFAISIQESLQQDIFVSLRNHLQINTSKLRTRGTDYLLYAMLDLIVDNYFDVIEKISLQIEEIEEEVINRSNQQSLEHINLIRKELIILQRNIMPVRDLIAELIRSENPLLENRNKKYFKDIYDHIIQAFELGENYRDMLTGVQDLYINNVNLRLNEIMKFMAVVTCLMAPASIISSIFGMNFDKIPSLHNHYGFYYALASMVIIPAIMLIVFKKRHWS